VTLKMQRPDCKVDQEICGEPAAIATHSLIESLGRNAVELREIGIQQHPLSAYDENAARDFGQWIGDVLAHAAIVGRGAPRDMSGLSLAFAQIRLPIRASFSARDDGMLAAK